MKSKVLLSNIIPYSMVHNLLSAHGFKKTGTMDDRPVYQVQLLDSTTQTSYTLHLPLRVEKDKSVQKVIFGRAYFEDEDIVPVAILEAIRSKFCEIADYLQSLKTVFSKELEQ